MPAALGAVVVAEFPVRVVRGVLGAMRLGSFEARQRFPRLLRVVEAYPALATEAFVEESGDVPCWMFLGWLSQMTALLDRREAKAVYHIVEASSEQYPQVSFVFERGFFEHLVFPQAELGNHLNSE